MAETASQLARSGTLGSLASRDPRVADGFNMPDLGANEDAPPAYGDAMDHLQLSQAGFQAGATVTDDGRVNININETNRKFASLLAPALRSQAAPSPRPTGPLPPAYIPPSLGGLPGQDPPPKLNVVIQIVGSRGDVQPFVALGQVLRQTYGHRVRIATHSTFQKFVEDCGLEFFCIGGDPAELMAFMVKNPGLMPGLDTLKSGEITKRRKGIEDIVLGCWRSCIEAGNGLGPPLRPHKSNAPLDESFSLPSDPANRPFVADAIIANPPSFAHIHIAEKMGIPLHMMFTMPWSPTTAFPHPLANIESSNTDVVMTNYTSYALVEMMTWQGLGDIINRFRTKILDLEPLSLIWAPGLLARLRIPTTYCWSPALIPKPNDWGREISIAGFYFLNLASSYTPDPDLTAFLADGPPPVYIGFGSIVVDNPDHLTETIFKAVSIAGVRALVSKGWGGLGADFVGIPDGVFMLGNCPHDWLFQHVSCVVHHGGAGTSAAGIKAGRPTVVVPFFGDQPFWGSMIHRAGAGPEPVPYKRLTAENLAASIQEAMKPETQRKALELGRRIGEEKGTDTGGKCFHDFLEVHNLRCSIAPSRVAAWRVRRTQTRLSPLAAAVLVNEGRLKYSDLKFYRAKEYQTEDQPWDPITAVTSSLLGDISGITMAIADIPRELFRGATRASSNAGEEPPKASSSTASGSSSIAPANSIRSQSEPQTLDVASDAASLTSTRPSIAVSTPESTLETGDPVASNSVTEATAPESSLSPIGRSPSPSRSKKGKSPTTATSGGMTLDTAIGTTKSVGRIVEIGMKTPLNVCMGLARGFRNAPRLYNDDTVRRPEKATDFASGLKVAGKEFGLGMYDGLAGLVTQPIKGAEKEGGMGLLKGFGKGIGGLVLKPAAAVWAVPAYTLQGIHAEMRRKFATSFDNYIITARVQQGNEDFEASTPEERQDILARWSSKQGDLKGFYLLRQKERKAQKGEPVPEVEEADEPPLTGWLHTRHLSTDERRKLQEQKGAWKQRQASLRADDADELERAIRESVRQTSHGDPDEDAHIEQVIRASLVEMQHIAQSSRDEKKVAPGPDASELPDIAELDGAPATAHGSNDITDEEFQELIAMAVQQSLTEQQASAAPGHATAEEEDEFRRALEESRVYKPSLPRRAAGEGNDGDEDAEQMRRAIEESERAHREQMVRDRTEEDIVMDFVKRQSLAEDEFRRQRTKGKGKIAAAGDDDDDNDLKRALEESLRISGRHGETSGSSHAQQDDSQG